MKIIKYISLFKYLIEDEGLNPMSAYRNIQRIRMLPPEFKQAVFDVLSSYVPDMEIEGVSFRWYETHSCDSYVGLVAA